MVNRIIIKNGAKHLCPVRSREEDMAERNAALNVENYTKVLKGDKQAKMRQPQRCYNLYAEDECLLKGCAKVASTVAVDYDIDPKGKTEEELQAEVSSYVSAVLAHKQSIGLLGGERTRKGVHLICRRQKELSQSENLKRISHVLGLQHDTNAKDLQRIYFSPPESQIFYWDDEIYRTEEYPFVPEPEQKANPKPRKSLDKPDNLDTLHEHLRNAQPLYKGLQFSWEEIQRKWWHLHNGGELPQEGERNAKWFDFLCALSYFTTQPDLLRKACGACTLENEELEALLQNVCANYRPKAIPAKLQKTMEALMEESRLTHKLSRRSLARSLKHSLAALPSGMDMAAVGALTPAIGSLATRVRVSYENKIRALNIQSFIAGESGSNKGALVDIVYAWTAAFRESDAVVYKAEEEWRQAKRKLGGGTKQQPQKPTGIVRMPTVNSTLPQLCSRLGSTHGQHAFTFCEESDEFTSRMSACLQDISSMLRKAYDGSCYERETVGAEGVNVHITNLLWNPVFCGTPDSLHRLVTNVTDGLQNRLAIASTPDNSFKKLEFVKPLTEEQKEYINEVARLLMLFEGTISLPKLEQHAMAWVEEVRQQAEELQDKVLARSRMRTHVTAYRMTVALLLVSAAEKLLDTHGFAGAQALLQSSPEAWIPLMQNMQKEAQKEMYTTIADSLINESLRYFRARIEAAYRSKNYAAHEVGRRINTNDAVLDALPRTFSFNEVLAAMEQGKSESVSRNAVSAQLRRWKSAQKITKSANGYEKL
ncbi:MAG: DUF3987 domain-containing protein [Bacteroidaceae bacterium]|nr:DUF3987 domain-containing protein [Bacteroidaceae bacterium]